MYSIVPHHSHTPELMKTFTNLNYKQALESQVKRRERRKSIVFVAFVGNGSMYTGELICMHASKNGKVLHVLCTV